MEANFETLVLYSDTESLIYETESEDLYKNLNNNDAFYQEYDFSNYYEDMRLHSKLQKLEALKFEDEMGEIIHSVIALKSRLYPISMGDKQKLSAKGTTKYAEKRQAPSVLSSSCQRCFTQNFQLYTKLWKTMYLP